ncbi:PRA1 family protein 3 [Eufriesea mexicana]|uniref:PRA1 family protein n=1 Tax=Eufriesea mexicana TaxID=516756 RepID=A0A310SIM0_9HYME|nr:PRA1 family protein 3 [Eufriesea mexicana]
MIDSTRFLDCEWEFPPFRTLHDFLLESSRFQLPNYNDLRKWNNRIVNNLVYYQTNYLYTCIAILLVMLSINPVKMLIGMATLVSICGMFFYYFEIDEFCVRLKRNFPQIGVIYAIMCGSTIFYTQDSVIYALFSILLSFCGKFFFA